MRPLAVIAEALAVIADDHDDRAVEQSAPLEDVEQLADLRVDVRDRSLVRVTVRVAIGSRRLVRRVRVVEVQPRKEARARHDIEPLDRARDDFVGATPAVLATVRVPTRDHGVVVREPAVQPSRCVEDGCRNERARPKPRTSEHFGKGVSAAPVAEHAGVVVNTVSRREAPCKQAGVGRKRQRRHRLGGFEENALFGEAIEMWCQAAPRSVRAKAIGAEGVERDDHQVQLITRSGHDEQAARARRHGEQKEERHCRLPSAGRRAAPCRQPRGARDRSHRDQDRIDAAPSNLRESGCTAPLAPMKRRRRMKRTRAAPGWSGAGSDGLCPQSLEGGSLLPCADGAGKD